MQETAGRPIAMPIEWLLAKGPPWVRYWTYRDLLDKPADDPAVLAARHETLNHPRVQGLLADVAEWPGPALKRHNDAAHPLHKLAALAAFGMSKDDVPLAGVIERVLANQSVEGAFTVSIAIHERFGGDGQAHAAWMFCDTPTVLYALLALGLADHPQVQRAMDHLVGLVADNGWRCVVSANLGNFRGPGRKGDPCPYATLIALKAISQYPELLDSAAARTGIETLLWHWDIRQERKVYLFGIGTDFRKPKYPLVWYDILHVTDVLSRFPGARADERFQAMVGELMLQADAEGRFTARSMYRAWAGWDFADKKQPSPTITAAAWQVYQRAGA